MKTWKRRLIALVVLTGAGALVGLVAAPEIVGWLPIRGREVEWAPRILLGVFSGLWLLFGVVVACLLRGGGPPLWRRGRWVLIPAAGGAGMLVLAVAVPGLLATVLGTCLVRGWAPLAAVLGLGALLAGTDGEGERTQIRAALVGSVLSLAVGLCVRIALGAGWFEGLHLSWATLLEAEREAMVLVTVLAAFFFLPACGGLLAGLLTTSYRPVRGLVAGCGACLLAPLVIEPASGVSAELFNLSLFAWLPVAGIAGAFACLPGCFVGRGLRGVLGWLVRGADAWSPGEKGWRIFAIAAQALAIAVWFLALGAERGAFERLAESGSGRAGIRTLSWSPDGRRLLFKAGVDGDELYVVDADGGGLRRVTSVSFGHGEPQGPGVWSGDGSRVFFRSRLGMPDGRDALAVAEIGSGRSRRLSDQKTVANRFSLSPDGRRVAIVDYRHVHVVEADGSGQRTLNDQEWMNIGQVVWCGDSGRLLVEASHEHRRPLDVFVASADGTALQALAKDDGEEVIVTADPRCQRVLLRQGKKGDYSFVVRELSSGEVEVAALPFGPDPNRWKNASGMTWSRDGARCRFLLGGIVWELSADLKTARELFSVQTITGWEAGGAFAWEPEAKRLGLLVHQGDLYTWLWLDEEDYRLLAEGKSVEAPHPPAPSPDGRFFLLASGAYSETGFEVVDTRSGRGARVLAVEAILGTKCTWGTAVLLFAGLLALGWRFLAAWTRRIPWLRRGNSG